MIGTVYTIWLREMKRFIRSKARIVGNISMPFIWMAILGIGLSSSFVIPGGGFDYLEFIVPGIIGMTLLFTSIFSGISVIWERQFGFLKEILVAPVSRTAIVLGKIAGSVTISVANGAIILVLSILIGAMPLTYLSIYGIAMAFLFMVIVSVCFVSTGLIIASRLDNTEGFQMIMSFLVMPVFFLSGAFFPIDNVPLWMKSLAHADPLMYGVDGLRGALIGVSGLSIGLDILVLSLFSLGIIAVSVMMFRGMR